MTDEVSLRRRVEKGRQAAALLEDLFFKEAVETVKNSIWDQFRTSQPDDDVGRRYARAKFDALEGVVNDIRWYVGDGQMAANALRIEEDLKERRA